jgi:hypothetical protein
MANKHAIHTPETIFFMEFFSIFMEKITTGDQILNMLESIEFGNSHQQSTLYIIDVGEKIFCPS